MGWREVVAPVAGKVCLLLVRVHTQWTLFKIKAGLSVCVGGK